MNGVLQELNRSLGAFKRVVFVIALTMGAMSTPVWGDTGKIFIVYVYTNDQQPTVPAPPTSSRGPVSQIRQPNVPPPFPEKIGGAGISLGISQVNQKALIFWNGREEFLILSTKEMLQSGKDLAAVVAVLPLSGPPLPTGTQGADGLVEVKDAPDSFFKKLGAIVQPPNGISLSVESTLKLRSCAAGIFHVSSIDEFKRDTENFLDDLYRLYRVRVGLDINNEVRRMLQSYLDNGFEYFACYVTGLSQDPRQTELIGFYFQSPYLYYPMKISNMGMRSKEKCEILLWLVTNSEIRTGTTVDGRKIGLDIPYLKNTRSFVSTPRQSVGLAEFDELFASSVAAQDIVRKMFGNGGLSARCCYFCARLSEYDGDFVAQ